MRFLLLLFCELSLAHATAPATQNFWVWDLNVMPPGFRKTEATLRFEGKHSLIYVEPRFWGNQITETLVEHLAERLENSTQTGSINQNLGFLPLEESIFGALPTRMNPDSRLIVLFADLGKYKTHEFDGFFNVFDQFPESVAWKDSQQHSNEKNIIYINGFRKSEEYTFGVIAHELQHLLAHPYQSQLEDGGQDVWLSEMLAEGAMLLTGYVTDQNYVDRYLQKTHAYPLVASTYVQYGPQLLFSSFLLDRFQRNGKELADLTKTKLKGRKAVAELFQSSFDETIYPEFLRYLMAGKTQTQFARPTISPVSPSGNLDAQNPSATGQILPYAFQVYSVAGQAKRISLEKGSNLSKCARDSELRYLSSADQKQLWIYAVGCDSGGSKDKISFSVKAEF